MLVYHVDFKSTLKYVIIYWMVLINLLYVKANITNEFLTYFAIITYHFWIAYFIYIITYICIYCMYEDWHMTKRPWGVWQKAYSWSQVKHLWVAYRVNESGLAFEYTVQFGVWPCHGQAQTRVFWECRQWTLCFAELLSRQSHLFQHFSTHIFVHVMVSKTENDCWILLAHFW